MRNLVLQPLTIFLTAHDAFLLQLISSFVNLSLPYQFTTSQTEMRKGRAFLLPSLPALIIPSTSSGRLFHCRPLRDNSDMLLEQALIDFWQFGPNRSSNG
jgi:hypothetical protein